jgi:hypothetical protein
LVRHLGEGLGDVQSEVDQDAISGALDFVVPEKNVGLEEADGLINDVGLICCALR